jgi:hypothetical protein
VTGSSAPADRASARARSSSRAVFTSNRPSGRLATSAPATAATIGVTAPGAVSRNSSQATAAPASDAAAANPIADAFDSGHQRSGSASRRGVRGAGDGSGRRDMARTVDGP